MAAWMRQSATLIDEFAGSLTDAYRSRPGEAAELADQIVEGVARLEVMCDAAGVSAAQLLAEARHRHAERTARA